MYLGFVKQYKKCRKHKILTKKMCLGNIGFARIFVMASKRSLAAVYWLLKETHQIKCNQLLRLKFLRFKIGLKDGKPKSNDCVIAESVLSNRLQTRLLELLKKMLLSLKVHYGRFGNLPISSSSYKNDMLKISH